MEAKTIRKDQVAEFLDALIEEYQVWAPVLQEGIVLFEQIDSAGQSHLGSGNTKLSPRKVFMPQTETMFYFEDGETREPEPPAKQVLFGVRPCDAASLTLLDAVFHSPDYPTYYYGQRRDAVTLVGLGCTQPYASCFCTDVGGDPFNTAGLDMLLTDLGDRYLVEVLTPKGEALIEGSSLLNDASAADLAEKERIADESRAQIQSQVNIDGLKGKLDTLFDDPIWDFVHETCLGCGICTFSCPTCHCFDIVDESDGSKGRRLRIWDSCQYPLFTHHTSGHNPRPSGKQRMRQRVMHKFHYLVENQGIIGCVGCGRCVRNCPAGQDIRETLNALAEKEG